MEPLSASTAILLAALTAAGTEQPKQTPMPEKVAAVCYFSHESAAGMNKICYYSCLGGNAAITISAASLCPLSINR